jgi:dihydrofolate reductase
MIISLVVAASTNNAIGKGNQLLWHLPNDLKFFKNTTWAMPVAMGRKTFESLGGKPLNGRLNIIITRQEDWQHEGVVAVSSLDDAIFLANAHHYKELFIAGGGEIYNQSLEQADKVYLTRVHAQVDGDTFFPELKESQWKLVTNQDHEADEKHAFPYSFQLWERR